MGISRTRLDELRDLTGGEPDVLGELIATFLGDTRKRLVALVAAIGQAAAAATARIAHAIKGASRTLGAHSLGEIAAAEALGGSGCLEGAAELAARLEKEFQAASRELEALLATLS